MPGIFDPLSPGYDPEDIKSPWSDVKDQWKKFDAVKPRRCEATPAHRAPRVDLRDKRKTLRRKNLLRGEQLNQTRSQLRIGHTPPRPIQNPHPRECETSITASGRTAHAH